MLCANEGAQFTRDVWNPLITVLPFVLLVFVAWSMSCAEAWALPVGVAVATFLVQTHVSYGLVSTVLLLAGLAGAAITGWRRRGDAHHRDRIRAWARGGGRDRCRRGRCGSPWSCSRCATSRSNLGRLLRFFRDHGREHSYGDVWHVVAAQLGAWPDWVHGHQVLNIYTGGIDLTRRDPDRGVGGRARRRRGPHVAPVEGRVPPRRVARAHDRRRRRVGQPDRRRHLPLPRRVDLGARHAHVAGDRVVGRQLVAAPNTTDRRIGDSASRRRSVEQTRPTKCYNG